MNTTATAESKLDTQDSASKSTHALFSLIDLADTVLIDHMDADEIGFGDFLRDGRNLMRITGGDGDVYIADQQVRLLDGGNVDAVTTSKNKDNDGITVHLTLKVERGLTSSDLPA
ncbi:hypothetical protein [Devosia sp.]|uniref:hypothetical protein n=1 Tax=Devosia sp. TaxID=1871048 RepID=UPI0027345920|nr:hypothetical protein [Devosia sp.]MDP2780477.1 hypothetical protein [Devosia sp.]